MMPRKELIKKADKYFSLKVRLSYNVNGLVSCVTCGSTMRYTHLGVGHYIRRGVEPLRYDVKNVHPQCCPCNSGLGGNQEMYSIYLLNRYGAEVFDHFDMMRQLDIRLSRQDLEGVIDKYRNEVNLLLKDVPMDTA